MTWTVGLEAPDFLYHYSEDPCIEEFAPHVPASNPDTAPAVWAIDAERAPLYWFPRDCPRVAVWANDEDDRTRLHDRFGTDASRLQVTLATWREPMTTCELFEYRLDPRDFVPVPEAEGQWIATAPQRPVSVEPAGDLAERQRSVGVDLRFVGESADLADLRRRVLHGELPFSIVRYRPDDPG